MNAKTTIFWFRQDLRLTDNPGLYEASGLGKVIPVYILDDQSAGAYKMGEASRWWLLQSLKSLNKSLNDTLNVYVGDSKTILEKIIENTQADAVYWNRCYEPFRIRDDSVIKTALKERHIDCKSFNGSLLWEPWEVLKKDETPYKVFTPYYQKGCLSAKPPRMPLPSPANLELIRDEANTTTIETLNLLPTKTWYKQMEATWEIGEAAAQRKLHDFLEHGLEGYKEGRNFPNLKNVSRLSPHLHFGEISPNTAWYGVKAKILDVEHAKDRDHFLSELGWREFSHHLLFHFPDLPSANFQHKFDEFPWQEDPLFLKAWQTGQTGYPIVDAGMRELWQTGYMHNRVRMIVGSFLVKNLLIHWHHGRDWFWDCLVDADLANNSAGWQWIAGSGADAAPYFRIFNPITQGQKFDPEGNYTRHYLTELKNLPSQYLFNPWEAPREILEAAGIDLGKTYPKPIINLESSRTKALEAYQSIKVDSAS